MEACAPPTSLAAAAERYAENLAWLYRADPELAVRVEATPFSEAPALLPTRDGHFTVQLDSDDGRSIYAHSRYRPITEARQLVDAQPDRDLPACILNGLGLGYHLVELERRYDRPLLIVIEDDLALLKAALCVVDLTAALEGRRLIFLTDTDKGAVHERLVRVNADLMTGLRYVVPPYSQRRALDFQREIRSHISDFVAYGKVQVVTLLHNARITTKNVAFNLGAYLARPGIDQYRERARGYPAIVVAAGPSLARNVDQLAQWTDRAVVVAVQTVFRNLLARGMPPHFVTSLDYNDVSMQFFRGITDAKRTILVAEPKATWHVPDYYPGRKHMLPHKLCEDLLRDVNPKRDRLKGGSTVAHLCFYLAEYLGCDPIIFLGQDLSFTEGLYYSPGMPIERMWQPELNRFNTLEMKQWERVVRNRNILRPAEDIHGRPAYTDEQMFTYAEQFQTDFSRTDRRIIHACEGGMKMRGMEIMTLREAGERFCGRTLPADLFAEDESWTPAVDAKDRAIAALRERLQEVRAMKDIATETVALLKRLEGLVDQPREFNRLVARVDVQRTRIREFEATYRTVVGVSQLAELRRHTADRRLAEIERETAATARRRLTRDREFVSGFVEGCAYLEVVLPDAIARLNEQSP